MQSGLHARFRNSENGRDFFHAQMLNVPKNEHITVIRAEGIDGVLNGFPDFTLFEQLEQSEIRKAVQNAINSLSPNHRNVLVLRDVQHLSMKEITAILGISEASVKSRLHRARLVLRDSLAPGMDGCWTKGQPYRKVRSW